MVFRLALIISLACIFFPSAKLHAFDTTETAGWYIDTYGVADQTALVKNVKQIFQNVKKASVRAPIDTNLVIVENSSIAWAIALPDGNIVISTDTLDLAYQNVDKALGDARMAFILGHELAHQANRDFWHQKLSLSGSGATLSKQLRVNATQRQAHYDREIKADESGFVNASLAGYKTDRLVMTEKGNQDFFEYWVEQTNSVNPETHPDAADRSALLRSRLETLGNKVELFKYGVRMAHFGRYSDARELLLAFEREYPSREVLNNLGYVYLQMARQQMSENMAYRFWFPTLLETSSGFNYKPDGRSWMAADELPESAMLALEKARDYLVQAVRLDKNDIVSRANLVVVNLYLGNPGTARDLVDEAGAIKPGDTQILGLRALVLYQQEPDIDTWHRAVKILKPLSKLPDVAPNIIYNYSQLLKERGRDGAAKEQWTRLAEQLDDIPFEYQRTICREIDSSNCSLLQNQSPTNKTIEKFWVLPLGHGDDIDRLASRRKLADWNEVQHARISTINTRLLIDSKANSLLALDNKIEHATLKSHPFISSDDLLTQQGKPLARIPLAGGEIWSYGDDWSALVNGNEVTEIWISRP